jgi:enoyl-CoA hydratase/carnithine racemase
MGFGTAIATCLGKYVDFQGRARRSEYWWWVLFTIILGIVAGILDGIIDPGVPGQIHAGYIGSIMNLAVFLPSLAVAARRLHDTNRSAFWLFPSSWPTAKAPVLRLMMNRTSARNALSAALMAALQTALDDAGQDRSVRAIVLGADGPAFSSGHDLKEMTAHRSDADHGREAFAALFAQCSALMQTIVRHRAPVIAQVQGIATAAGCQLVASCDLAVASSIARFATPGVNIGLFCSTPMVALSRNVSRKHAMEMLLTGEMISAEDARRIGLINRVVDSEHCLLPPCRSHRRSRRSLRKPSRSARRRFTASSRWASATRYDYASRSDDDEHARCGSRRKASVRSWKNAFQTGRTDSRDPCPNIPMT